MLKQCSFTYVICISHRSNILLDQYSNAKLDDFGFSQEMPQMIGGKSMITATVVAKSLGYSAPELDTCHISHKSDIYAYGMVSCYNYILDG